MNLSKEMNLSKLKRYRQLKSDISALGKQIEGLYNTYRSPNLNRIGSAGKYSGSPVSETVDYITTLQETFTAEYEEMVQLGKEIEAWIQTIHEPTIVAIIRCYYLCGMDWKHASKEVYGYPDYYRARRAVMRWFGKEK